MLSMKYSGAVQDITSVMPIVYLSLYATVIEGLQLFLREHSCNIPATFAYYVTYFCTDDIWFILEPCKSTSI